MISECCMAKNSYLKTVWKRFKRHKLAMVSLFFLSFVILVSIIAPLIAPYHPDRITGDFGAGPGNGHLLGTDDVGRDVLSRVIYATRVSLLVGVLATFISTVIGVVLGLVSGFFGRLVDSVIMRFTDMVMSFPYLLLVLVAAAIFGPSLLNIVIILGFVNWPGVARLVRGNVLSLRERAFVQGSIVAGLPKPYILFSEILPNTIAPVLIHSSSVMAFSILDEAALSFLGMGVQAPTASLGNMLGSATSQAILTDMPWLWIPPGVV
ncbi:MAG TPA: ABC transporter permease, partial [Clostridiaceae bacterium]|nr:ABC transporter permease [Clostridiaceae bacterium]